MPITFDINPTKTNPDKPPSFIKRIDLADCIAKVYPSLSQQVIYLFVGIRKQ